MTTWQASNKVKVFKRYGIREDRQIEVLSRAEVSREYDPWQVPGLPSRLADIQPGNDDLVLKFVHEWGMLGSFDRVWEVDPVDWVEKQAAITRIALELIDLVQRKDSNGIDRLLALKWPGIELYAYPYLLHDQSVELHEALNLSGLPAGSAMLLALLKDPIQYGVGFDFSLKEDGIPSRFITASNLLEVIYCHLWDAWEGKTGYYQCEGRECPKWWPVDRKTRGPKPKYCPNGSAESLCSRRERYYRSRPINKS